MRKYRDVIISIVSLLLAYFIWHILENVFYLILFTLLISIGISFLFIALLAKKSRLSKYRIFAVINGIAALSIFGYAMYTILFGDWLMSELTGYVLLFYVLPVNIILLLIDYILYNKNKKE